MGPLDFLNHLLNFILPALAVSGLLVAMTRFSKRRAFALAPWWAQWGLGAAAGAAVLAAGILLLGPDGKMMTYTALVAACATAQWLVLAGWRK
ncbi:MAG: hypothetical protein ABW051_02295 [Burkholderiaceae bacterium]